MIAKKPQKPGSKPQADPAGESHLRSVFPTPASVSRNRNAKIYSRSSSRSRKHRPQTHAHRLGLANLQRDRWILRWKYVGGEHARQG